MRRVEWAVLWSLWASRLLPPLTATLRLPSGCELQGRLAPDGSHAQYLGIPYASVRRFQAPAVARWRGVLRAENEHARCAQSWPPLVLGEEDCLRLNVYVPEPAPRDRLLPVMVFVHGGGFYEGSGSRLLYGPDYLVGRGVVLVTFNYRLAAPGFLCLGTKEAPGNAGMKDQVAALKWVRENIATFGGDPDNVTLFGESAGAASVSYHLVSPMSRGLFHKAILQSGSSLAQWALQGDVTRGRETAARLVRALGHEADAADVASLHRVLTEATISELLNVPMPRNDGKMILQHLPYAPCVENVIDGEEAFITEHPYDTLSKGDREEVPVIIGFNDVEGYYFLGLEENPSSIRSQFERRLPEAFRFATQSERDNVLLEIKQMYLANESVSETGIANLARFYGEAYVVYPVLVETELLARSRATPVFAYRLRHVGWRNFAKLWSGPRYWLTAGATHADDLFYLFNQFPLPKMFETDMIRTMTTLWTDFAKYGSPGGERWSAVSAPKPLALQLQASPRHAPLWPDTLAHWRRLHRRYGRDACR